MAETSLENVADLIARPPEEYAREPRYVSKYREKVRTAAKRGKSAHKTLGVPSVTLNPPTQYLKKNSNEIKRPEVHHKHYHRPGYQHKLPEWQPIKAADREPQVSHSHSVDFTKRNIDEATNLRPRKARKFYVDDRHGTSHPLRTSGLYPLYRNKKYYGQYSEEDSGVPEDRTKTGGRSAISPQRRDNLRNKNVIREGKHKNQREDKSQFEKPRKGQEKTMKLSNVQADELITMDEIKEKMDEAKDSKSEGKSTKSATSMKTKGSYISNKEQDDESVKSSRPRQPKCRYVTEDERAELLYGMKKKWDEMMHQFQCLPFLTDTPPKAKRKSKMEKDLYQLEKDIEVIERHPYIYVYSDAEEDS